MSLKGNHLARKAHALHVRKKYDQAAQMFLRAQQSGITSVEFALSYATLMLRLGDGAKAKQLCDEILSVRLSKKKKNCHAYAMINGALARWQLGQLDEAIEMFWRAHREYKSAAVYGSLGYLLIEAGDLDGALEYNLEGLDYDDRDASVLDNLGQVYYRKGDFDQAREYFEKALGVRPKQPESLYYLALIEKDRGEKEKARELLSRALDCEYSALSAVKRAAVEKALGAL